MGDTGLEPVTSALSIRPMGRQKSLETDGNRRFSREKLVPVADRAEPQKPASIRWMEDARRTQHRCHLPIERLSEAIAHPYV